MATSPTPRLLALPGMRHGQWRIPGKAARHCSRHAGLAWALPAVPASRSGAGHQRAWAHRQGQPAVGDRDRQRPRGFPGGVPDAAFARRGHRRDADAPWVRWPVPPTSPGTPGWRRGLQERGRCDAVRIGCRHEHLARRVLARPRRCAPSGGAARRRMRRGHPAGHPARAIGPSLRPRLHAPDGPAPRRPFEPARVRPISGSPPWSSPAERRCRTCAPSPGQHQHMGHPFAAPAPAASCMDRVPGLLRQRSGRGQRQPHGGGERPGALDRRHPRPWAGHGAGTAGSTGWKSG